MRTTTTNEKLQRNKWILDLLFPLKTQPNNYNLNQFWYSFFFCVCYYYYTLCREPGNSDAQHMQRQESEAHKYIHARRERETERNRKNRWKSRRTKNYVEVVWKEWDIVNTWARMCVCLCVFLLLFCVHFIYCFICVFGCVGCVQTAYDEYMCNMYGRSCSHLYGDGAAPENNEASTEARHTYIYICVFAW